MVKNRCFISMHVLSEKWINRFMHSTRALSLRQMIIKYTVHTHKVKHIRIVVVVRSHLKWRCDMVLHDWMPNLWECNIVWAICKMRWRFHFWITCKRMCIPFPPTEIFWYEIPVHLIYPNEKRLLFISFTLYTNNTRELFVRLSEARERKKNANSLSIF